MGGLHDLLFTDIIIKVSVDSIIIRYSYLPLFTGLSLSSWKVGMALKVLVIYQWVRFHVVVMIIMSDSQNPCLLTESIRQLSK